MEGRIFIILVLLTGAAQGQSIITPPDHATETIGGVAKFVCEVILGEHAVQSMIWKFNNSPIYLYTNGDVDYPKGTEKYTVRQKGNTFILEVVELEYSDGGKYVCSVVNDDSPAELIVLGSPVITTSASKPIDGENVTYTCKANYGGPKKEDISPDHRPQLTMGFDGDHLEKQSSEKYNGDHYHMNKVFETAVEASMDGKRFTCEITTKNPDERLSSFKEVNVQYSVRNISASPLQEEYTVGTILTCDAKGNPEPQFEWQNEDTPGQLVEGRSLNITSDMVGKQSLNWTCTANNKVGGKMNQLSTIVLFKAVPEELPLPVYMITDNVPLYWFIGICTAIFVILFAISFKRAVEVRNDIKKKPGFIGPAAILVFGNSFPHGWNTGVMNNPQKLIKDFLRTSFEEKWHYEPNSYSLEGLWAASVSLYLLGGCVGSAAADAMDGQLGRKKAFLVCSIFGLVSAPLFGFCEMFHSLEMLLLARLIVGFGCGAGCRLVLKDLEKRAKGIPQGIVTALVLHQIGITCGILLSQIIGLQFCLGKERFWPILLALTAVPSIVSILSWYFGFLAETSEGDDQPENKNSTAETFEGDKTGHDSATQSLVNNTRKTDDQPEIKNSTAETSEDAITDQEITTQSSENNNLKGDHSETEPLKGGEKKVPTSNKDSKRDNNIIIYNLNICQQLSGINIVFYYSLSVFEGSGVPAHLAQSAVLAAGIINVLTTGISMVATWRLALLLSGIVIMIISAIVITVALIFQSSFNWLAYATIFCMMTFVIGFALQLGSMPQSIGAVSTKETESATHYAGLLNWTANFCVALFFPFIQMGAKPYYFIFFIAFLAIFLILFSIKSPKIIEMTKPQDQKKKEDGAQEAEHKL